MILNQYLRDMHNKQKLIFTFSLFLLSGFIIPIFAQDEGSLNESPELLSHWPDEGPELLWEFEGIGNGYSTPAVNSEIVFVTGEINGIGYLFKFDLKGELKWKREYGKEWIKSFDGTRATPNIVDGLVYVCSGMGDIVCFDVESGEKLWSINMVDDLKGTNNVYGYSMQLLIDEDTLYCLPGGSEINIVALNRFTGKTIWTSKGMGETAGYGDAIIANLPERKLLISFSEFFLMGIDANSGEILWSKELALIGDIPCNKPIYEDGFLYYVAGPGNGSAKLKISDDGNSIEEVWTNMSFDTSFGGFVKYKNYLYGNLEGQRVLGSINAESGKLGSTLKFRKGAVIVADGLLYCYNESGYVGLIKPVNGELELLSKFRITKGTKEHFTRPVIAQGRLFIRHGNALLVYDIRLKR